MRRGSRSRLRPVPISVVVSTLPSTLVSVLGTTPRLGTLPGAAYISSISVPRPTMILVPIAIPLITIISSVIQSMIIHTIISVIVPVPGPTVISVIGPIIPITTSVTIVSPSSVVVLIPVPAIQPIPGSYNYYSCNCILNSYLGTL